MEQGERPRFRPHPDLPRRKKAVIAKDFGPAALTIRYTMPFYGLKRADPLGEVA